MSQEIPVKYQALFKRVNEVGAKSKAEAIKAFCLQCVGYKFKRVTNCTSTNCCLYQVRPYQKSDDGH